MSWQWRVCAKTAKQFTVWRYMPGPYGANVIERIRNTNGNTKRFRSKEAAHAAAVQLNDRRSTP